VRLGPLAVGARIAVAGLRERRHQDAEASDARPPAEVQVVVVTAVPLVEVPGAQPGLPRDEHRA
jgi:hypothetical protein